MGAFSNYAQAKILNAVLAGASLGSPSTWYLAMFTVAPNSGTGSGGTEATGGGYVRLSITANSTNWPAATGGSPTTIENGVAFAWPQTTGDWSSQAPMVAWGLYDASTSGNLWASGALTESKIVYNGDTPTFPINLLDITLN
jgi:hypothetical protein